MSMNQHQIITSENLASICKLDFSLQSKKKNEKEKSLFHLVVLTPQYQSYVGDPEGDHQ